MTPNHATWRAVAVNLLAAAEKLWLEIEGAFRSFESSSVMRLDPGSKVVP